RGAMMLTRCLIGSAHWRARPERPELGYRGDPASPLQAIQGFPCCRGGDSRKCIGKRHLHRPAGALRIRLAALPTPELWGLYRRPACCRVCGSLGLVIARTFNTTSPLNTGRGFLGLAVGQPG